MAETTEEATESFQITREQAEVYEERFVPGIFAEWAPRLVAFAGIAPGDDVLDVACGTGIVARSAAEAVGPTGSVTGLDLNPAMLEVAARVRPDLTWRQGEAASLPFPTDSVDVVTCQMALMFMPDPGAVLAELARVARRLVALLVPAAIGDQPAYSALTEVVARHAGADGAALMATYWSCGDLPWLLDAAATAGLVGLESRTVTGTAAFPSAEAMVATEVEGSPLVDRIDEATYALIREDGARALAPYATAEGAMEAPLVCHLVAGAPG
jgi:SAM-dependent methyltransferase